MNQAPPERPDFVRPGRPSTFETAGVTRADQPIPLRERRLSPWSRRKTHAVDIGGVCVGGGAPVVVQSMTNTDTADVPATVAQVAELARAGSELVRVTVNHEPAAAAVPEIVDRLRDRGVDAPIIGDFHYNGHLLLRGHPECARALSKYRINPGNVGAKRRGRELPADRAHRDR